MCYIERILSVLFEQGAAKKNIFAAQIKQRLGSFRACGRDLGRCPKTPVAFSKKRPGFGAEPRKMPFLWFFLCGYLLKERTETVFSRNILTTTRF
ncbi:MAG: hypothetical protein IKB04_09170, partial [Clostridia bacterium]|nr:hypothetical protein [Clostridia bacterium]